MTEIMKTDLAERIERLIAEARKRTVAAVNTTMVYTYAVGQPIFQTRSRKSSSLLTKSQKPQTLSAELHFTLNWSHYLKLMRIENPDERRFYEIEATENNWSLREL